MFVDLNVSLSGNKLTTDLHAKSRGTNCQYFSPLLKDFRNTVHKNLYLLYMDQEVMEL